eukprot:CAMPEP_0171345150 /NCGR_PEP_ID=MMETSP0878-20121228/20911_1 /TAXON_ID=67004 /ORGANISM="Thalassiosira weissflogii, Strain CCMP1336" /LENGTH=424 /DNA_ID=CAMNT_0011848495 /DNA_START=111 /DNA_END=1385 /DNA_ORIENTATION=+
MSEEKEARDSMEASRIEVMEAEQEIQSIKNSLKSLAMSTGGATMNSLRVSVHKVTSSGDSNEVKPTKFKIHLSSPIEERVITKLYDPLDPTVEGSFAEFSQIEAANALVTVEAFLDADGEGGEEECKKLGASAAHDLLPLCEGGKKNSIMVDFAIVPENEGASGQDTTSAEKEADSGIAFAEEDGKDGEKDATDDEGPLPVKHGVAGIDKPEVPEKDMMEGNEGVDEATADEDKVDEVENSEHTDDSDSKAVEATTTEKVDEAAPSEVEPTESRDAPKSNLQLPICTLSVQLEFIPSPTDKRDALYDKLNEVSKRKAAAIEKLRQSASAVNRAKAASDSKEGKDGKAEAKKSQVVKAGFLNKPLGGEGKSAAQTPFWKKWYEKTIGPSSLLWVLGPVAKNYVVFLGISLFFHYKGDLLALPPPV